MLHNLHKRSSPAVVFLFSVLVYATALPAGANDPANILILTADNLGYGDLQMYNQRSEIRTPHLDAFASQGARLTQFYTASPTCTVSRACLLTGRIAQRHGLVNQLPGIEGNYGVGLNPSERLIPQWLRSAPQPYATGCFGKWNIGFAEGSRPTERGFDSFLGHASGNMDYFHHVYNGKHDLYRDTEPFFADGKYATDLFADAAIDFITHHSKSDTPWFCYLPFNAPHFPNKKNKRPGQSSRWQAPAWAFDEYGFSPDESDPRRRYCAVVTALDAAIGRVLASLEQSGQSDNTFVFFMSDNGAFRLGRDGLDVGINDPLRDGGVTCWEGGIRVPALARWPGRIQPGTIVDVPLWSPDILVACMAIADVPLPQSPRLDGKSPLPALTGQGPSPHSSMLFQFRNHTALRQGNWKIVRERPDARWQLFNLANDPEEANDVAQTHPDQVTALVDTLARWQDDLPDGKVD